MSAASTDPASGLPTPDEVRDMVGRIVDGLAQQAEEPGRLPSEPGDPVKSETPPTPATPDAAGTVIAIGGDHGGYAMKERLGFKLREAGYEVRDCGTDGPEAVDYPDIAHEVARLVSDGTCRWGIIVDGAGIGSAMAANKVPGVRAAACYDLSTARNSREHNHANVLTLGAGLTGDALAWQIVQEWLSVPWGGGRHGRRVDKIAGIERAYSRGGG